MSPVAINGVDKQGVGINGVQVKQALNADNETVDKGVYAATTLSAVDAELAVGNIKDGVTIFGFLGTLSATLAEDLIDSAQSTLTTTTSHVDYYKNVGGIASGVDSDVATITKIYDANSLAIAHAFYYGAGGPVSTVKLRLYMDGTSVAESGYLIAEGQCICVSGSRALAGSKICKMSVHSYAADGNFLILSKTNGQAGSAIIAVGSVKVV